MRTGVNRISFVGMTRSQVKEIVDAAARDTFECGICGSPKNKGLSVRYTFQGGRSSLLCVECASAVEAMRRRMNNEEERRTSCR